MWQQYRWCIVLLVLAPPLLIFPQLGSSFLWQDEAETALLGQRVAKHGYPLADDGESPVISDQAGREDLSESGLWVWSPWLDKYLAAAGLLSFGNSSFAARLPFALIGWATLFLCLYAFADITKDHRLTKLAVVLLMLSVWYLLYVRQCRYYSPFVFASLVYLWGYIRLLRGARGGMWMFIIGGAAVFHCFYPFLIPATLAMGAHLLLYSRQRLTRFLLGCTAVALLASPFAILAEVWSRDYRGAGYGFDDFWRYVATLRAYLVMSHVYAFPFFLAVPLAFKRWRSWRRWSLPVCALALLFALAAPASLVSFVIVPAVVVVLLAIGATIRTEKEWISLFAMVVVATLLLSAGMASFPYFRYLLGVLPILALGTAATILGYAGRGSWLAAVLTVVFVLTNFFQLAPFHVVRPVVLPGGALEDVELKDAIDFRYGPINRIVTAYMLRQDEGAALLDFVAGSYLHELTHDYDGPLEKVVSYLERHGRAGDSLMTFSEIFTLLFHSDLHIVSDFENGFPDWILFHSLGRPNWSAETMQEVRARYRPVEIDVADQLWENIPEPYWHRFRHSKPEDGGRRVTLLRKIRPD
jgi:hypothetical protein